MTSPSQSGPNTSVPSSSSNATTRITDGLAPPLRRRMACWLYEGMLLFGVVFIAGYLFSTLTQTRHALDNRHALQAFLFVVFGIYFVWFWSRGYTLAMKTWHIRVVDRQGRAISQTRALLRYVLSWLWFLPPLAAYAAGVRVPASCTQGMCGTCKSSKLSGEVDMQHNGGIRPREIAQGKILLCCSTPLGDVRIDA